MILWASSGIPILTEDEESQNPLVKVDTNTKAVG